MEKEEISNTTDAKAVKLNFKTKEDHKDLIKIFGMSMSGRDKQLTI